ncbi:MAG TPA: hypothetical protein VFS77_00195 [Pyrinomonadaceae bacterium]|nr:hypothetical protein [Pyrinomonadaceae bacterium]
MRGLVAFMLVTKVTMLSGWVLPAIVLTSAGFLLLGFMTPIVAVAIGLISLGLAFSNYNAIEIAIIAFAIALLGPGGFSIDARMFGRREVFIPDRVNAAPVATDRSDR